MSEQVYDEVKAVIYIKSNFAIRIRLRNNRVLWVPDSQIGNIDELILYGNPDFQVIKISLWFCRKYDLESEGWI